MKIGDWLFVIQRGGGVCKTFMLNLIFCSRLSTLFAIFAALTKERT